MGDCVAADIGKTDYKLVLTSFIECISQVATSSGERMGII